MPSRARWRTSCWGSCWKPMVWRVLWSALVRTVTPRMVMFPDARQASRIISGPPAKWMVVMETPSWEADSMAWATVLGMSWNLRSRKTLRPFDRASSIARGPAEVWRRRPILTHRSSPSRRVRSWEAAVRLGTSRARMIFSFARVREFIG